MNPYLIASPHALTCETAVLGSAIAYPPAAAQVLGDLDAHDFTEPRHQAILAVLRTLIAENVSPELPLVLAALWRQNGVRPPTGHPWALILADLVSAAALPAATPAHRRALLEARLRREALTYATRLHDSATTGTHADVWHSLTASVADLRLTLARLAEQMPRNSPHLKPIRAERAA